MAPEWQELLSGCVWPWVSEPPGMRPWWGASDLGSPGRAGALPQVVWRQHWCVLCWTLSSWLREQAGPPGPLEQGSLCGWQRWLPQRTQQGHQHVHQLQRLDCPSAGSRAGRGFAACMDRKCVPPARAGSLWGCSGDKQPCPAPAPPARHVPQEVVSAGGPAAAGIQALPGRGCFGKPLSPWVCDLLREGPCAVVSFTWEVGWWPQVWHGDCLRLSSAPFLGLQWVGSGWMALGRQRPVALRGSAGG